jgi:hypothetical protein
VRRSPSPVLLLVRRPRTSSSHCRRPIATAPQQIKAEEVAERAPEEAATLQESARCSARGGCDAGVGRRLDLAPPPLGALLPRRRLELGAPPAQSHGDEAGRLGTSRPRGPPPAPGRSSLRSRPSSRRAWRTSLCGRLKLLQRLGGPPATTVASSGSGAVPTWSERGSRGREDEGGGLGENSGGERLKEVAHLPMGPTCHSKVGGFQVGGIAAVGG